MTRRSKRDILSATLMCLMVSVVVPLAAMAGVNQTMLTVEQELSYPQSRQLKADGDNNVFKQDNGALSTYVLKTYPSTSQTGTVTLTALSNTVQLCSAASGYAITLPAASNPDKLFLFFKTDNNSNAITVTRAGSDTINGATTYVINTQFQYVLIHSDGGTKWNVIDSNKLSDMIGTISLASTDLTDSADLGRLATSTYTGAATITSGSGSHFYVSNAGANYVLTLPACSAVGKKVLTFLRTDSAAGGIYVTRAGADTIEVVSGSGTAINLTDQWHYIALKSDGTSKWYLIDSNMSIYQAEAWALRDNDNQWVSTQSTQTAGTYDLGSTTKWWRDLYLGDASDYAKFTGSLTGARTVTIPDANSTFVVPDTGAANNFLTAISAAGVISKAQPSSSNLSDSSNIALRNNGNSWSAAQVPNAAGTIDLGSTTLPFRDLYLRGAGANYARFLTTTLNGNRTVNIPNADSTTVQADTGAANNYISAISAQGVITKSQPSSSNLSDSSNIALRNNANSFSVAQVPSANTVDFGQDGTTWRDIFFRNNSTSTHKITATTPTADRTHTFPNADSNTVIPSSGSAGQFATGISSGGVISYATPTVSSFGGDGSRTLPTSGSISGIYMHSGNWTSTGTLTFATGTRIYITGTMTLNHDMTGTARAAGGIAGTTGRRIGGMGDGPMAGAVVLSLRDGGSGGGCGGAGGTGGSTNSATCINGWNVGRSIDENMETSSGSGGAYNNTDNQQGGSGGGAGATLYIECLGNVTIAANITADGAAGGNGSGTTAQRGGAGGGGSGGIVDIRTRGTYTQNSTKVISCKGGAGGVGGTTRGCDGGGGGGGLISVQAGSTYTQNGSFSVTGGAAAGTSGETVVALGGNNGQSSGAGNLSVCPRF